MHHNHNFRPGLDQLETRQLMSVLPTIQTNHPALEKGTNAVKYEVFNAPLFTPGKAPVYSDVHQGEYMGDCWLLATLADAAYKNPQLIRNMFTSYGATTRAV